MIEKIVLDYLNGVLKVPCYMEAPEKPIAPYVVIEKTGESETNKIFSGTLASLTEEFNSLVFPLVRISFWYGKLILCLMPRQIQCVKHFRCA